MIAVVTVPLSIVAAALILRAVRSEMNALVFAGLAAALTSWSMRQSRRRPRAPAAAEQQFEPDPVGPGVGRQGWIATRRALVYATVIIVLAIVPRR